MTGEEFPLPAKKFLNAFYTVKKATTDLEKYNALKDGWNLQNASFYSSEEDGLKTLEFYVLTKLGML